MQLSEEEWRQQLTPEQYHILREQGTEPPFSSDLVDEQRPGEYACVACGTTLFNSSAKYESRIRGLEGWPSFADVLDAGKVELRVDNSYGMDRTEVVCKTCGSHLGHVFDGDPDSVTGQHYCISGASLQFTPEAKKEQV